LSGWLWFLCDLSDTKFGGQVQMTGGKEADAQNAIFIDDDLSSVQVEYQHEYGYQAIKYLDEGRGGVFFFHAAAYNNIKIKFV